MTSKERPVKRWKQLERLINNGGEITIGPVATTRCAAVASDGHNSLAMLVRYPRESLEDLLARLDEAIRRAVEEEEYSDEING